MLQPSIHPMNKSYEAAQDSVGAWFRPIGLKRGQRHKAKWHKAIEKMKTPKPKVFHKPTYVWRQEEDLRLAKEARKQNRRARKLAKKQEKLRRDAQAMAAQMAKNKALIDNAAACATRAGP